MAERSFAACARKILDLPLWAALASVLSLLPELAYAQARTLSWDSLIVHAELDKDGRLHVTERHAMRMDGAWNGGERRFRLETRHSLQLLSLREITRDGSARTYLPGTLDNVGEYRFTDAKTLRWRSRSAEDPPFHDALRVYELRYVLSGILVQMGSEFLLDHDFAFPERDGLIHRFAATLRLDPAWRPVQPQADTIELSELVPGTGAVRRFALRYAGSGRPASASGSIEVLGLTASGDMAAAVFGALVLLTAAWFALIIKRERASGHLAPMPDVAQVDRVWLDQHVFCYAAEVIGAAWDRQIGPPEVAALLARLTFEGKLHSEVVPGSSANTATLRLALRCDRKQFPSYERELIEGLFFDGDTTDTTRIRKHYADRGFDPAARIKPELELEVAGLFGRQEPLPKWRRTVVIIATFLLSMILHATTDPRRQTTPWVLACIFMTLVCWGFARYHAGKYRDTVTELRSRGRKTALGVALLMFWLACVHLVFDTDFSNFQFLLLALFTAVALWNIANALKPRELALSYQLRRQIAVAREYFARELASPTPRIEDAWFAYLIAFDLGPDMDQWFRAFGGTRESSWSNWDDSPSRGASQSSTTAAGWSGGGGAFGGAGASGTWAMAVGAVAAGVSAPSSSSSSGGSSSSSSSSGGGGGGGW